MDQHHSSSQGDDRLMPLEAPGLELIPGRLNNQEKKEILLKLPAFSDSTLYVNKMYFSVALSFHPLCFGIWMMTNNIITMTRVKQDQYSSNNTYTTVNTKYSQTKWQKKPYRQSTCYHCNF